jgi:PPM family protein phosphatase
MQILSHSEPGGHPNNEDAFAVEPIPGFPGGFICALAEGQGGRAGGAEAARIACVACVDAALKLPHSRLLLPSTWVEILRAADRAVSAHSAAGFTTVLAYCISRVHVCGASNGDSAAIVIGPDGSGSVLTEAQVKNPPIGSGDAAIVPFAAALEPPWAVVAMSDGVWKYAGLEGVLQKAASHRGQALIDSLRDRATLPISGGLQDDFTIVAVWSDEP